MSSQGGYWRGGVFVTGGECFGLTVHSNGTVTHPFIGMEEDVELPDEEREYKPRKIRLGGKHGKRVKV